MSAARVRLPKTPHRTLISAHAGAMMEVRSHLRDEAANFASLRRVFQTGARKKQERCHGRIFHGPGVCVCVCARRANASL